MKLMYKIWLWLAAVLVVFVLQQERLSALVFRHDWLSGQGEKILAGQKRGGEFKARADRLGAIKINLDVYSQTEGSIDTYDSLIFRIREKGSDSWYYQSRHNNIIHGSEWYANRDYGWLDHSTVSFPFGFPVISDSRGKTYQMEIESVVGTADKAFVLSRNRPDFISLYLRGEMTGFIIAKAASLVDSLFGVPPVNYLLILFLAWLAARRQKIPQPWLICLAVLWLLVLGSVAAYLIFGGSEKLEWGIYMAAAAGVIPLSWLLKRVNLVRFQSVFIVTLAGLILWLSLRGDLAWRHLIFLPMSWLTPAVLAYFYIDFPYLPLWQVGLVWFVSLMAVKVKVSYRPPLPLIFAGLLPLIIFSVLKPIDYHHYISFAGAAFDVLQGKQLLVETPSIYGYLSIHFVAMLLKPFGVTLASFHLLNMILFAAYFLLAVFVIVKLVQNRLLALITAVVWITLTMIFSYHNVSFPPQIGPLRFGISLLLVALLIYLPSRLSVILGSGLAAIALFWSAETAVYVVPAWLATLLAFRGKDRLIGLGLFPLLSSLIYLWAKNIGFTFSRFVEFASSVQGGVVSLPIPFYGNYYVVIPILILGAVALVYRWRPLLVFLVIHNLAIFSYFVSRSHENNIVNLSGFIILELIVVWQSFGLKKLLTLPLALFLTLFGLRLLSQSLKLNFDGVLPVELSSPVLTAALDQYGLLNRPVALLSESNDTRLLLESGITNELPLNPAIMNTWLKPGEEYRYLNPALERLKVGTIVIVDVNAGFLAPAWDKIQSLYQIETIDSQDNLTIYEIRATRI